MKLISEDFRGGSLLASLDLSVHVDRLGFLVVGAVELPLDSLAVSPDLLIALLKALSLEIDRLEA